jgi:DNA-binding response OmpR family regulator
VRLLVIEDEPKVGQALREGLQAEGYEVVLAETGEDGFFLASNRVFDLIVLDVMLPGRDGLEVLAALRKQSISTPVLLLTAKDAVESRVAGLDAGADDHLVKRFAFSELSARIRALSRRGKAEPMTPIRIGTFEVGPFNQDSAARGYSPGSYGPRVRIARIPRAEQRQSCFPRNVGARCVEGARAGHAVGQRNRRTCGAPAKETGRPIFNQAAAYGSWCRILA